MIFFTSSLLVRLFLQEKKSGEGVTQVTQVVTFLALLKTYVNAKMSIPTTGERVEL